MHNYGKNILSFVGELHYEQLIESLRSRGFSDQDQAPIVEPTSIPTVTTTPTGKIDQAMTAEPDAAMVGEIQNGFSEKEIDQILQRSLVMKEGEKIKFDVLSQIAWKLLAIKAVRDIEGE